MTRVIASVYSLLARHKSPAADELLLDAARLGDEAERGAAIESLLHRGTARGLAGLVELFRDLPESLRRRLGESAETLSHAVARCSRSDDPAVRVAAAEFIGATRSPRLAYILPDLLQSPSHDVFEAACAAAAGLAEWAEQTAADLRDQRLTGQAAETVFESLVALRPSLEDAVSRALETPRGLDSPTLASAATRLLDRRQGAMFEAYKRHAGRPWPLVMARMNQPGDAASATALLSCAGRGTMRQEFAEIVGRIERPGVLDGLVRNVHWLEDPAVEAAVAGLGRGAWWSPATLRRDLAERVGGATDVAEPEHVADPDDLQAAVLEVDVVPPTTEVPARRATAATWVGKWLLAGGLSGGFGDDLLDVLLEATRDDADARLSLLRSAESTGDGSPLRLLTVLLGDSDERVSRMAARSLSRRPAASAESALLRRAAGAPESVRGVINRTQGVRSFDGLWNRHDRLSPETRRAAGRALLKLLPAAGERLRHHLLGGDAAARIRGLAMLGDLDATLDHRESVYACCVHADAKVRSKATLMLGEIVARVHDERAEARLEAALEDGDARVRANAVEVLQVSGRRDVGPLLRARGRLGRNRERANAIRASHVMGLGEVESPLFEMLRDGRDPHRLSAVWAVEQTGQWRLLDEVVRLARSDTNLRVRRSALAAVRRMAENMRRPTAAA